MKQLKQRLSLLCLLVLAGCGDPETPPPPPQALPEEFEPSGNETVSMTGAEFYLYDTRQPAGAARKPLVTIQAGELDVGMQEENTVSFRNAKAIIRSDDPASPEMVFEAAEGLFSENQRAYLKGGVVAQVGEMTVQLEDIEMNSPTPETALVAETRHPVTVDGPGMHLEAQGLRLYPDDKRFEMTNGTGYIDFRRLPS